MWFAIYKNDEIMQIGYIIEQKEDGAICSLFDLKDSTNDSGNRALDLSRFMKDGLSIEMRSDPTKFFKDLCKISCKVTIGRPDLEKEQKGDGIYAGHDGSCVDEEAEKLRSYLKELERKDLENRAENDDGSDGQGSEAGSMQDPQDEDTVPSSLKGSLFPAFARKIFSG